MAQQTITPVLGRKHVGNPYYERLVSLLTQDLDFHDQGSGYASHNFHSFPAKFPPQLPRLFIESLTAPGDVILDPMVGSGTTVVEALLANRHAIGIDIDPLAVLLSRVKVTDLSASQVNDASREIVKRASRATQENRESLVEQLQARWDHKTRQFADYWFAFETQIELAALIREIEQIPEPPLREFFLIAFSSIIITKSGGVSLAFDLAHTRPHRAKVVIARSGGILLGQDLANNPSQRVQLLTKTLRSPLSEFEKRVQRNVAGLIPFASGMTVPDIRFGDAQQLPLDDASIDLIVTSPPYVSNAIDYMRAHKFSLIWWGYPIDDLGHKRSAYVGGEALGNAMFENLPELSAQVVAAISHLDRKKGRVVHRYYSEMTRVLREMYRVLKPNAAAIVIVGTSVIRGVDVGIEQCLAEIGRAIGFEVPKIGARDLDRNRRMLPASSDINTESQIQRRMHEEYVIGFLKPR